jgi:predicted RNase H-like nuclease (RuvC/YqgF family)
MTDHLEIATALARKDEEIRDYERTVTRLNRENRDLITALKEITRYCTSGERYKTQNPYTVPEIKQALIALTKAKGKNPATWMDAADL